MAKMLSQNFHQLEALYSTLLEIKLTSGSDVESNLTEIFLFLKNPYLRADKYYPTCGVNEILLRLMQCLKYFQTSDGSAYQNSPSSRNDQSKVSFSCSISRPKQHENYKVSSVSRSMEDVFCTDPAAAYYANLSWLYYELQAAQ
uniref:Uncharacterized protein n=1 Tax=Cacopsylla melanoneura TaxID=428564 RepID=A0A8D9DQH9_9HEMI